MTEWGHMDKLIVSFRWLSIMNCGISKTSDGGVIVHALMDGLSILVRLLSSLLALPFLFV
jgi:hypothetical protein